MGWCCLHAHSAEGTGGAQETAQRLLRDARDAGSTTTIRATRLDAFTAPDGVQGVSRSLRQAAQATEQTLWPRFDAFIEPRIGPTPFPTWIDRAPRGTSDAVVIDPELATYLTPLPGGWAAWVLPGQRGVCLTAVDQLDREADIACATTKVADARLAD